MASPSFIQAREEVARAVADSSDPVWIDRLLNLAQKKVCRARRWPELVDRAHFSTVGAYSTGTVSVTEGDATVTLTGGTFPTAVASAGYRFSLSVSDPPYLVRTRTSGTVVELAETYKEDTDASTSYLVHKPDYALPSTVERVEEMWLLRPGEAIPLTNAATDETVTAFLHFASGPGVPCAFYMLERDAQNNRRVLLGPETPDDVYRVEYTFLRKPLDNQFEGNLDDSRWPLIVSAAKAAAYEGEFYERSLAELKRYEALLIEEWGVGDETTVQGVRVGDDRVNYPNMGGMEGLLGRGRVVDPT